MLRTHTCGELRPEHTGKSVTLCGWVYHRRDHGGLIFVDLRDRYGVTQVVIDPEVNADAHKIGEKARSEWVLKVTGNVVERGEGLKNDDLDTGAIELVATEIEVLNQAVTPPFEMDSDTVREDLRLKYRYLDLRRERMQKNLKLRHDMVRVIREYFHSKQFLEIETPIMVKGTPEGSREYLVPSRLHHGEFYVLPQSPQQLKQLLMVGAVDRYFQVARCFRDEDLRGDRQPEFTQFEIEMSFVDENDVMNVIEDCFHAITKECAPQKNYEKYLVDGRFLRMTWFDAMSKYGSDKPDLRFDMQIKDVTEIVKNSEFGVFSSAAQKEGNIVNALRVPGGAKFTRKEIDDLTEHAKKHGAKGLAYIVLAEDGEMKSPILKFMSEDEINGIISTTGAEKGDIIFFGADKFVIACEAVGAVRSKVGDMMNLKNKDEFAYLWVYDFPMMEEKEDGSIASAHHPFTRPHESDRQYLRTDVMKVRSHAYDVVLNGVELGGGSIRIHESDLQKEVFEVLGMEDDEIEMKFGHMIKAFTYGCPPHGGCAMGLDRVVMLFADEPNIREVMAFPKNQSAQDLMLGSPAPMPEKELSEQNIMVIPKEDE